MSTRRNRILTVALPVGAIVVAVVLIRSRPQPPRTPAPERVPSVTVAEVGRTAGAIPIVGNGTVRPRAEVELTPQVAGQVDRVSPSLVSGGRVQRGEILVWIDDSDFRNAVQQAQAQVAQDSVAVLEAAEEARIAREEYAQFQARQRRLGSDTNGVAASREPSPLVLREPQLQAARAALARSQAQLADAELALSRTRIRAPFDGVVRSETVDPGSFAAVGQSLARLYADDAFEVVVPLTDADAALIPGLWELRPGGGGRRIPATVVSDYGPRRFAWDGFVDRVQTALDEQSRTIDVVVQVQDPFRPGRPVFGTGTPAPQPEGMAGAEGDGSGRGGDARTSGTQTAPPLLVGQYVEVGIAGREGVYQVVPRRALRPGDEVWAVADSAVRIVPVEVLQQLQDSVFVIGDFRPGDAAVTGGIALATNGMKVRPAGGER